MVQGVEGNKLKEVFKFGSLVFGNKTIHNHLQNQLFGRQPQSEFDKSLYYTILFLLRLCVRLLQYFYLHASLDKNVLWFIKP